MMKALLLRRAGEEPKIEDVPVPQMGSMDVLIAVKAAGICHTDLGIIDGHVPIGKLPMILGHEIAGEVVKTGKDVSEDLLGKRICVSYGIVCGSCEPCLAGNDTLCDQWESLGRTLNGGFAEYMVAPAENAIPLPPNVSYEEGAIIPCSVATSYHAVKRANIGFQQKVAIIGVGGLGLNALQFARLRESEIIAVDVLDQKLEKARSLGANYCINAKDNAPVETIRSLTAGRGADAVLEFVGSPATYQMSIECVKRGGVVVIAGHHLDALKVNPLRLMLDEVTITGAHVANRSEIREVLGLLENGESISSRW